MLSRRPILELLPDEISFYEVIDGNRTVTRLEEQCPGARDLLRRWHEAEILELVEPVTPPRKPAIVVIEPHMDDAMLSAGGRLLNRSGRSHITVLSVVKRSIFTSYLKTDRPFLNCEAITDLRKKESELACRLIGAEHTCLGWDDSPLRVLPADRWNAETAELCKRELYLFTNYLPNPREVRVLAEQLARKLRTLAPDELWIPMGLGNHVDHRMTRNACLLMLSEARSQFENTMVSMYEDLPYAGTPGHRRQIEQALKAAGNRVSGETEEITDVFEKKARAVSVYASQFKSAYIVPGLREYAERDGGGGGKLGEAYLRLEGNVGMPPESHLAQESTGLRRLESQLQRLTKQGHEPERVTIIALPSGSIAKWKSAKENLLKGIPGASFRIYVPSNMTWQMDEDADQRVSVRSFPNTWRSFLRVVAGQALRIGSPVVILWRGAYCADPAAAAKKAVNLLFRVSLPFRRLIFSRTLADLCCFLNQEPATRGKSWTAPIGRRV
jgi:LmbE family N-acetylglucosaminyl deacetylase